ncbi:iron-containing alcohol dehydrogenase [Marinobacter salexigens]|uniref:iron-containing alcohol dehydrogenase n=1 Tax=Marinobacter salexigens TaxID=1925763 RepID=UPI000C284C14|nr:iron-containing alcohol dehydrogenase [Marinobacter salexigens]
MSATVVLPRIMEIGPGALTKLPEIVQSLGGRKVLIITDSMMVSLGYAGEVQALLSAANLHVDVFDGTEPEPTAKSIEAGLQCVLTHQYDLIIALGGGSPIDSAKAIAILGRHRGNIRDYKFPRQVNEAGIPLVAIPTTAGTGSEVTRFTIITDEINDEKMLCAGVGLMPMAAIVDVNLTLSVPPRTTADTGIDALTHAIEAYVSQKANPFSDSQALSAMKLIGPNLKRAYIHGNDLKAREAMILGSTLAGMAFSSASVALVHGMSRPIGAFFHVPHGLSNAMLLPSVTKFSIPAAPERYADCARAIGVANAGDSDEVANQALLDKLNDFNRELKVPTLAEFGVSKENFDQLLNTMAEQAFASGSPDNNPRVPSTEQMITLYQQLWH